MKRNLVTICWILLVFSLFGFISIYIGLYSLNVIDAINLWHEERNRVAEIDRTIRIKAVVDQEYKDIITKQKDYGIIWGQGSVYFARNWKPEEFIEIIINRASKSFKYQFGIEFVLAGMEVWEPESWNSAGLMAELKKKTSQDNCDMIVGFTGRITDLTALGEAPHNNTLGNYVLVGLYLPEEISWLAHIFNLYHLQSYILVHELGHTFGAVHPEEIHIFPSFPEIKNSYDIHRLDDFSADLRKYLQKTFSIMNLKTGYFTTHFDDYNREIILQNKYLPSK